MAGEERSTATEFTVGDHAVTRWLLCLQILTSIPITNAYASQIKNQVVVSVTYDTEIPVTVCTFTHALDDADMTVPVDSHCWKPTSVIGDFDTWEGLRLDEVNFEVMVRYPNGRVIHIYLTTKINT